ncbi:MAG: CRISPR-associated protein Cas4 [Blastocatellia bacterium]
MPGLFNFFVLLALALAILAALGFVLSRGLRRASGLPDGEVVYEDAAGAAGEMLVSKRYGLCGKPDYLVEGEEEDDLIPVEVKSGRAPRNGKPYRSHLMQLAVYFLLVEDVLERPAPYGLIRYRDRTLRITNTDAMIEELLSVLDEMREVLAEGYAERSHDQIGRCAGCSVAHVCNERLA